MISLRDPEALRDRVTDLAYGAGWYVVCRLPERVALGLFRLVADVIWRRRGPSVQRFEENLVPVLPVQIDERALRTVSRAGLRSYLRYWCEAFRLPVLDAANVRAKVVATDEHLLRDALAEGHGVICALPHMANWDLAGAWMTGTGESFTTVAERLKPASLFARFVAYREGLGMEVLAAADPDTFATLSARLRSGRLVALVADRDLSAKGVDVQLGRGRTRLPIGPAALAMRTGAALIPVTLWYEGQRLRVRFHPRLERLPDLHGRVALADVTQRLADVFTAGIVRHPHDWHMIQPFWVEAAVHVSASTAVGTGGAEWPATDSPARGGSA